MEIIDMTRVILIFFLKINYTYNKCKKFTYFTSIITITNIKK